jgi:hypothetical protein
MAASCGHPLQDNAGPRGALTFRLAMFIVDDDPDLRRFARPLIKRAAKQAI